MRPLRLEVAGITRFRDPLTLDLSGLPDGIIALVGDNGSGKSTLLECLGPAGIYRDFATYPGSLLSSADPGRRDCWVDLTVEYAGHEYRHLHQLDPLAAGGRGKAEANLWRDGVPVAERRTSDYDEAIATIYPGRPLFLAAAFSAQDGGGDWIGMAKRDRRDLFAEFLGLAGLQAASERARERKREADARADVLRGQVAMLSTSDPVDTAGRLAYAEGAEAEAAAWRDAATGLWRDLSRESSAAEAAIAEHLRAVESARARAESRRAQRERDTADVQRWTAERADLERVDLDAIRAALAERERLTAESRVLSEAIGLRDRERRGALSRAEQGLYTAANANQRAADALKGAITDADLATRVPCGGAVVGDVDCSTCELLAGAVRARESIPALEARAAAASAALESAKAARRDAEAAADEPDPDAGRLADLQAAIAATDDLAGDAHRLRTVPTRLVELRTMVDAARARLDTPAEEGAVVDPEQAAALRQRLAEASGRLRRCEEWGKAAAALLTARTATRARLAEEHRRAVADATRATQIASEIDLRAAESRDYGILERGLGRDGLQALEIDRAGPEVSDLLNELLSEVWGPRFRCQLTTMQEAGRGKVQKEVFDLDVLDGGRGGDPRPIERYSHGERSLISEALRLSLAVYASRRSSAPLRTLFRDEADKALQADLAERYPSMLRRAMALGGFTQCYLISHRDSVWEQADALIRLADGRAAITIC